MASAFPLPLPFVATIQSCCVDVSSLHRLPNASPRMLIPSSREKPSLLLLVGSTSHGREGATSEHLFLQQLSCARARQHVNGGVLLRWSSTLISNPRWCKVFTNITCVGDRDTSTPPLLQTGGCHSQHHLCCKVITTTSPFIAMV